MEKELIKLFIQLVEIDSLSGEEKKISDFVLNFLQKLDLNPIQDNLGMIYCRIGHQPNPILFSAHLDTVEPGRNIKVIEDSGYLLSEGKTILGGDNKVALACILSTIKELIKKDKINIELLFTVREETDSGISSFNHTKIKSNIGFTFDTGQEELNVVTSQGPTIQDFEIIITGKAAHASLPEEGNNVLNLIINLGKKINLGRIDKDTTLNIGLIQGGTATNTIPANLILKGDLRSTNHQNFLKVQSQFSQTLKDISKNYNLSFNVNWIPYSYFYNLNLFSNNFSKLKQIYRLHNVNLRTQITNSGSDAGFLNHIGVECFCLGDGVLDRHTENERIKLVDIFKLQKIIQSLMINYMQKDNL